MRMKAIGTDLRELEERIAELERDRELLNAIANYAPSLICLIDPDGRVRPTATNRAFERALGYKPGESGGDLFWEKYVHGDDAADARAAIEAAVAGKPAHERDSRWLTRDGATVDVAWTCTRLPPIASGPVYLVSGTDVTERKRHEEEVRHSRERILTVGLETRKRLERNLHDGAQQRLIALLLFLRGSRRKDGDLTRVVDDAIDELAAAIADLRELARGIHPAALTELGLGAALRQVAERAPVPVELDAPDARYDERLESAAYYIASEALANMARYAGATSARVTVHEDGASLVVTVEDDGAGGADPGAGTGLRGLADRVAALDGTFAVDSPPGAGTRIRAELPL
jgi:PAS domain S-box-containing protein